MMRVLAALVVAAAIALVGLALASCSSVNNERIGVNAPPYSEATFQPVGDFLIWRCGTGDCHGQPGRNFRVWGCDGMRLDPTMTESCISDDAGGGGTTNDEYVATYRSFVGLEPQVMSTVWSGCSGMNASNNGYPPPASCHPELLTLMQKARGTEKHKGGQLICLTPPCPPGIPPPNPTANPPTYDLQDECLVTWLEGNVNANVCDQIPFLYGYPVDASAE